MTWQYIQSHFVLSLLLHSPSPVTLELELFFSVCTHYYIPAPCSFVPVSTPIEPLEIPVESATAQEPDAAEGRDRFSWKRAVGEEQQTNIT